MSHSSDTHTHESHSRRYWIVGGVLLLLTLIEVGVTQFSGLDPRIPLFILMVAKVVLVAMFYMHLRSDSKWFAAFFLAPIPFIALLFAAMMIRSLPK
jgi:caa(3)-type oxidase subunit IV